MIVGIDLGTTNSAVAVFQDGVPILIPNRLGHTLTPSAVSVEGDVVLVGMAARERQSTAAAATATAFKRYMGTSRKLTLDGRQFSPEELSALVLRSLKEDAEAYLGEAVTEAVITVPAYFNDKQRRATRRAGELAGLKVERLINEPTAAALAYGIHRLEAESKFMVFDLGGGTFDVSILEMFEGIIEVRSTTGDNRLGGEDFNEVLVELARKRFSDDWGAAARGNETLYQKLREQAERAKRRLSADDDTTMNIVWRDREYQLPVTAGMFEELATPLLERLREPVVRALRDAGAAPGSLSEVVMIGGATRMPLVRRTVTRMFGRFPNTSVNPDEAVALGAAVQAGLKSRDQALREVVLTDVCPYSLGVDHANRLANGQVEQGLFSPIIERNTVIPASRMKTFVTLHENQQRVVFNIYQGESRLVSENVKIGAMEIPVRPGPAGAPLDVRFSYDINGLLEVDIKVHDDASEHQLVISTEEDEQVSDLAERRAALARLKVHPRDTEANRAAMARAGRCWSDALGDRRAMIELLIQRFENALATQDPRKAEAACQDLHHALNQVEGAPLL